MALRPRAPRSGTGHAFEIGLQFGLAVLIGVGVGHLLDGWLGTSPWLMLVFTALGFVAGLRNLLRLSPPPPPTGDSQSGEQPKVSSQDPPA